MGNKARQAIAAKTDNKKPSKAAANAALAKGAEEIKKAKAGNKDGKTPAAAVDGQFVVVEGQQQMLLDIVLSDRPVNDIIAEFITPTDSGVGIVVSDDMPVEQWATLLKHYYQETIHSGFRVGDMLIHGESHYADRFAAAVKATGLAHKTIENYVVTAKGVPPASRNPALTFSAHAEVVGLKPAQQVKVLKKAETQKLTVKQVREEKQKIAPKKLPKAKPAAKKAATSTNTPSGDTATSGTSGSIVGDLAEDMPKADVLQKLSPEAALVNESRIEDADRVIDFVRSDDFRAAPKLIKRQWRNILKPFASVYEELLSEVGKD